MSASNVDSSYDQLHTMFTEMSFSDKLRFNSDAAQLLKKEGKVGAVGKAAKKEKVEGDKPKKSAAVGTMAWINFVKHIKQTMPQRFEGVKLEKERLAIVGAIKLEDKDAYDAFVAKFKGDHSDTESVAEPVEPVAPVMTKAEKLAVAKKALEAAAKKPEVKKEAKKEESKKEVAKKEPKKVAKKEVKKVEVEEAMPKKEVNGETYFFDPETNVLFAIINGSEFGGMVGYFQPDNEEMPIRFTDTV